MYCLDELHLTRSTPTLELHVVFNIPYSVHISFSQRYADSKQTP